MMFSKNRGSIWIAFLVGASLAEKLPYSYAEPAPPADSATLIQSAPFTAQSPTPGSGNRLYGKVDPRTIGIDFFHKMNRDHRVSPELRIGCGVALGDYDGNGLIDVFLTSSTGRARIFRNLGDFRFADATGEAHIDEVNRWTTGASFADVDNDNDLDLFVCGHDCSNHLYINRGDGTFVEQAKQFGLDHLGASVMISFADYDSDGDLDAYLVTNHLPPAHEFSFEFDYAPGRVPRVPQQYLEYRDLIQRPDGQYSLVDAGQYDFLYRNNSDGTFSDVSESAGIRGEAAGIRGNDRGLAATWWDYNGDNRPDLYVANDFYGADRLYRNNGAGTFTDVAPDALPHTPWFSMGCDSGDLNNDGRPDLIGTDMSERTDYRYKMTRRNFEIAGWFLELPTPRQYPRNAVYLNSGAGRFQEIAHLTGMESTNWTWSVRCADLDQDGRLDVHFTTGMSLDFDNNDLKIAAAKLGPANSETYRRFWDDQPALRQRCFAFQNLGELRFQDMSHAWGLDHLGLSFGAAFADLDNDGDLDLIVNQLDDWVGVFRNQSSSGHGVRIRLAGRGGNRSGLGATVRLQAGGRNQSGYLTLTRGFMSAGDPTLHFGLGEAEIIGEMVVTWPSGRSQRFTELPADRLYTITESTADSATATLRTESITQPLFARTDVLDSLNHTERVYDDFGQQPLLPIRLSQLGPGLASGDVDGDNADDLFLSGPAGASGILATNPATGPWPISDTFFSPWGEEVDREDMGVLLLDVDGDSDLDLFLASGGIECDPGDPSLRDRLFLNDGSGNFSRAAADQLPDLRDSGSIAAATDFDQDGDLDLFVGSRSLPGRFPLTPDSRLLVNDSGKFHDATRSVAPELLKSGLVTGALWSDVNDDGWVDLLVTHDWGPIKLYLNRRGQLRDATQDAGLADLQGWWNGIAGRDLDNDGDIDYVVTNLGRNTVYRVSQERPARLFYGDFNADGKRVLVEGKYDEQGRLVPTRSKLETQQALPQIEIAFPTFHDYASATLDDIVGHEALEQSFQLSANTVDSVVLRNDGQGHFTVESLPIAVQLAPAFGVVLNDFNADGRCDAYVAQNSFSPRREIGRMDGGISVLLLGDQDGKLNAVSPQRSGLVVPGDAKSVLASDVDRDGWPDLVVGVNDAHVMAFLNQRVDGRRLAAVRLRGHNGNPTAIGARVTLLRSDGQSQTAEVSAGGGYLSQQPATLHFGLGSDHTIDAVVVRWPNGQTQRYSPERNAQVIELSQP